MRFERHPCLCCQGLVSKTCRLGLGEILQMQRGSDLGFPTDGKVFEKLLHLVSTCLNPARSISGNLLRCSVALEDTQQ